MNPKHNYEIPKSYEERMTEALESIAGSLKNIENTIASDPGDEVEHIYNIPTDYKMD
tara:strand:+ start:14858 stop:15028 length:171 start_codon:yes stop_codon:yes gene_type:complete